MGKSHNHPHWPERVCLYCGGTFRKAPTYATCGHPVCIKEHRRVMSAGRRRKNGDPRFPNWTPPDTYAPDTLVRVQVKKYLDKIHIEQLPKNLIPSAVQAISVKVGVSPAEVYEIWNSTRKEKSSA